MAKFIFTGFITKVLSKIKFSMKVTLRNNYLSNAVINSNNALKELHKEAFNSETLRKLFYDKNFVSKDPLTTIVISRETGKPVKVYKDVIEDHAQRNNGNFLDIYEIILYRDKGFKDKLGDKQFYVTHTPKGPQMKTGHMENKSADLAGLEIREDQFHVETAIKNGIDCIPRISLPYSMLYHIKMGFTPVPKLTRIWSRKGLEKIIEDLLLYTEINKNMLTPIITEKKGIFGKNISLT